MSKKTLLHIDAGIENAGTPLIVGAAFDPGDKTLGMEQFPVPVTPASSQWHPGNRGLIPKFSDDAPKRAKATAFARRIRRRSAVFRHGPGAKRAPVRRSEFALSSCAKTQTQERREFNEGCTARIERNPRRADDCDLRMPGRLGADPWP